MSRSVLLGLVCFVTSSSAFAQREPQKVFFSDIDHFWVAYDSIRTTTDSLKQLQHLQKLFIDRGTPGLKSFMEVRSYTAGEYVSAIRRYPKFWNSIRPYTQRAKVAAAGIEPYLRQLKKRYPPLRPASIYFTMGLFRSAGTIKDSAVLIGSELATGGPGVDVSEFPPSTKTFLTRYYKTEPAKNLVPLNVHEYVHTQQGESGNTLLSLALYEGTCDLAAKVVTGKIIPSLYMTYGPAHEAELKERFKAEMFAASTRNWFYNQLSDDPNHVGDLGYFMG